jgi:type I restriction enzyme M protein
VPRGVSYITATYSSAKNPNKNETIEHKSPIELVENIKLNNSEINDLMDEIEVILIGKDINE